MFFYSQLTGGFYHKDIHGAQMPTDVVEISAEEHKILLDNQSKGQVIGAGPEGRPVATPAEPADSEHTSKAARSSRDRLLAECDWTQLADVPEATKEIWKAYRQDLREISSQKTWPYSILWPTRPVPLPASVPTSRLDTSAWVSLAETDPTDRMKRNSA